MAKDLLDLIGLQLMITYDVLHSYKIQDRTFNKQARHSQINASFTHLFDRNADSDRVDGSLDQNLLLVITTDHHRLK